MTAFGLDSTAAAPCAPYFSHTAASPLWLVITTLGAVKAEMAVFWRILAALWPLALVLPMAVDADANAAAIKYAAAPCALASLAGIVLDTDSFGDAYASVPAQSEAWIGLALGAVLLDTVSCGADTAPVDANSFMDSAAFLEALLLVIPSCGRATAAAAADSGRQMPLSLGAALFVTGNFGLVTALDAAYS